MFSATTASRQALLSGFVDRRWDLCWLLRFWGMHERCLRLWICCHLFLLGILPKRFRMGACLKEPSSETVLFSRSMVCMFRGESLILASAQGNTQRLPVQAKAVVMPYCKAGQQLSKQYEPVHCPPYILHTYTDVHRNAKAMTAMQRSIIGTCR